MEVDFNIINIIHVYNKFSSIYSNDFTDKLEAQWAEPVSLTCHSVLRKLYTEPSTGVSYQISINLAKWFQRIFFLISQSQTRTAYGSHGYFVQAKRFQSRRFFRNLPTRNKNDLRRPCLLTDWDEMSNLYRCPSRDDSYQVLVYLSKRFQRGRFFTNRPTRNKNCLWQPCLLTDWDEMSNLYRGPSIDASLQLSVHLAKQFQSRRFFFRNLPTRNKNCLWWLCLLLDRDEMSNLYRGPSIGASYQVSNHLAEGFQRRRIKCEKLTDDGHQVMAKAHIAFGKVS